MLHHDYHHVCHYPTLCQRWRIHLNHSTVIPPSYAYIPHPLSHLYQIRSPLTLHNQIILSQIYQHIPIQKEPCFLFSTTYNSNKICPTDYTNTTPRQWTTHTYYQTKRTLHHIWRYFEKHNNTKQIQLFGLDINIILPLHSYAECQILSNTVKTLQVEIWEI